MSILSVKEQMVELESNINSAINTISRRVNSLENSREVDIGHFLRGQSTLDELIESHERLLAYLELEEVEQERLIIRKKQGDK
jgi:vacuolar-type H+-ATPase subunit D/Vma8